MKVLVSALLFCVPVALFANDMDSANVKADQNATNIVMNHDLNQAIDNDQAAQSDEINLDDGATAWHRHGGGWGGGRRGGWGRGGFGGGWGGGWGGWGYGGWGGYGLGWPYYGYGMYYPSFYGWGW